MVEFLKKYFFIKWWIPIILMLLSVFLFFVFLNFEPYLSFHVLFFGVVILVLAGIWQLAKGKWIIGLIQLGFAGLVIFVGAVYIFVFLSLVWPDADTFADNLELPTNVRLNEPLDLEFDDNFDRVRPKNMLNEIATETKFELYNSFQPGIYEFDVWLNPKESGVVYLKAFEITQEVALSSSRLKERSIIQVEPTRGSFRRYGTDNYITIYEGDWGQPYGARFEVWFIADNTSEEIKLLEKNYVIEGWMR